MIIYANNGKIEIQMGIKRIKKLISFKPSNLNPINNMNISSTDGITNIFINTPIKSNKFAFF